MSKREAGAATRAQDGHTNIQNDVAKEVLDGIKSGKKLTIEIPIGEESTPRKRFFENIAAKIKVQSWLPTEWPTYIPSATSPGNVHIFGGSRQTKPSRFKETAEHLQKGGATLEESSSKK